MVRRRLALITLLAPVIAGCHLGNNRELTKPPAQVVAKADVDVTRFIVKHNENAAAVTALSANPGIDVTSEGRSTHVDGMLRLEREKNFRLEITAGMRSKTVADIGSNDKGFWFWIADKDNTLYACNHDQVSQSPLAVTLQPDWIIEAMGLREITEREASTLSSKSGDLPGQLVLTQFRTDSHGETLTKETTVEQSTGHIVEQKLWRGAKKELLARAQVSLYQEIKLNPNTESQTIVEIPARLKLDWIVEKFSMDIKMNKTYLNQDLTEFRLALFTEPKPQGASRKDLAVLQANNSRPAPAQAPTSRLHETMPAPRSGVRLGKPMNVDGEYRLPSSSSLPPLPGDGISATPSAPDRVVFAPSPGGGSGSAARPDPSGNLLVR